MTSPTVGHAGKRVWAAIIDHRYGVNFSVHASVTAAEGEVAAYVREWWCDIVDAADVPVEPPIDDDAAISIYFTAVADESYTITDAPLSSIHITESAASDAPSGITTGVTDDGRGALTLINGDQTVTITGTYQDLRDTLLECTSRLYSEVADTNVIARHVWNAVVAELRAELAAMGDELDGCTVNDIIDSIHSIVVTASEWDNGWFPSPYVMARDASGEPIDMAALVDFIRIEAIDDGALSADLDDLTEEGLSSTWECVLRRP